jgi:Phytanoyl-CoA dioxygenase (PhyH)
LVVELDRLMLTASSCESFERDGFAIVASVLTPAQVEQLIEISRENAGTSHQAVLRRDGSVYGMRDVVWRVPGIRRIAQSCELLDLARAVLGADAFVVRGLFFDKTTSTNWNLPWHQDLTIAVKARRDVTGFGPWTRKAGIPHAHAPADLLGRMLTIRLHLDDCGRSSGPLRVLPGSHAGGKLVAAAVAEWASRAANLALDCVVPAGGAVVMRPLLLHASSAATSPGHRRVIHLEYAAEDLPGGLEWYGANG